MLEETSPSQSFSGPSVEVHKFQFALNIVITSHFGHLYGLQNSIILHNSWFVNGLIFKCIK